MVFWGPHSGGCLGRQAGHSVEEGAESLGVLVQQGQDDEKD